MRGQLITKHKTQLHQGRAGGERGTIFTLPFWRISFPSRNHHRISPFYFQWESLLDISFEMERKHFHPANPISHRHVPITLRLPSVIFVHATGAYFKSTVPRIRWFLVQKGNLLWPCIFAKKLQLHCKFQYAPKHNMVKLLSNSTRPEFTSQAPSKT